MLPTTTTTTTTTTTSTTTTTTTTIITTILKVSVSPKQPVTASTDCEGSLASRCLPRKIIVEMQGIIVEMTL